ncbi:hypothetical protein EJB05_31039, partial [Eragrostis curvula]
MARKTTRGENQANRATAQAHGEDSWPPRLNSVTLGNRREQSVTPLSGIITPMFPGLQSENAVDPLDIQPARIVHAEFDDVQSGNIGGPSSTTPSSTAASWDTGALWTTTSHGSNTGAPSATSRNGDVHLGLDNARIKNTDAPSATPPTGGVHFGLDSAQIKNMGAIHHAFGEMHLRNMSATWATPTATNPKQSDKRHGKTEERTNHFDYDLSMTTIYDNAVTMATKINDDADNTMTTNDNDAVTMATKINDYADTTVTTNNDDAANTRTSDHDDARTTASTTHYILFNNKVIKTTVTKSYEAVYDFIQEVRSDHRNHLVVGLDTEWRTISAHGKRKKSYKTAILQLCVGTRCLVFQIYRADAIPIILKDFLACPHCKFLGADVSRDVHRLINDYGLRVQNSVDLQEFGIRKGYGSKSSKPALKLLVKELLGADMEKDNKDIHLSWGREVLTSEHITYAAIDAFASAELGKTMGITAMIV